MIEDLYPMFLDIGYEPSYFWSLSIAEIQDLIDSYVRKQKRKRQEREAGLKDMIVALHVQALEIGEVVNKVVNGNKEPIQGLHYYYPDLFNQEETEEQKAEREKREQELYKARMIDFAHRFNTARKKRGEQ